jgi:hypothetical protein
MKLIISHADFLDQTAATSTVVYPVCHAKTKYVKNGSSVNSVSKEAPTYNVPLKHPKQKTLYFN